VNVWGGFELGSDVYVNTVLPEQAADYLRQPDQRMALTYNPAKKK
jgi:galactose-1-phosphate uridylyltransferase